MLTTYSYVLQIENNYKGKVGVEICKECTKPTSTQFLQPLHKVLTNPRIVLPLV